MKKLISIVLTLVFSMALFAGCSGDTDNPNPQTDPTPTPQPTPVVETTPGDEDTAYTYDTVLALWRDMDGYWARHDGGYMKFTIDEDGKAVALLYDRFDVLLSVMYPETVMASNKTTYVAEIDYPLIDNDEAYPDFKQGAAKSTITMEIAGFGDGFIELIDESGNAEPYVSVGDSLEHLIDGVEKAEELKK